MASTWSERHVAYVSGLGTFGLSGGLITAKGQAVRLGSVDSPGPYPVHTSDIFRPLRPLPLPDPRHLCVAASPAAPRDR